jgi:hypothetical protein
MPVPVSATDISTVPPASVVQMATLPPAGVYLNWFAFFHIAYSANR